MRRSGSPRLTTLAGAPEVGGGEVDESAAVAGGGAVVVVTDGDAVVVGDAVVGDDAALGRSSPQDTRASTTAIPASRRRG